MIVIVTSLGAVHVGSEAVEFSRFGKQWISLKTPGGEVHLNPSYTAEVRYEETDSEAGSVELPGYHAQGRKNGSNRADARAGQSGAPTLGPPKAS